MKKGCGAGWSELTWCHSCYLCTARTYQLPNEVPSDLIYCLNNQWKQQINIWWLHFFLVVSWCFFCWELLINYPRIKLAGMKRVSFTSTLESWEVKKFSLRRKSMSWVYADFRRRSIFLYDRSYFIVYGNWPRILDADVLHRTYIKWS